MHPNYDLLPIAYPCNGPKGTAGLQTVGPRTIGLRTIGLKTMGDANNDAADNAAPTLGNIKSFSGDNGAANDRATDDGYPTDDGYGRHLCGGRWRGRRWGRRLCAFLTMA